MDNNNNNILNNNTNNNNNPPPPLRLPPLPLPPPPPPETFSVPPFTLSPFPPPTTPTTASTSSPSSSHHRRKRSKLVPVDPPQPSTAVATTPTRTPSRRPDPLAPKITPPCTECGKTFWSWKALFGHMRCHPERQWRGINPPPHLRLDSPQPPPPPPTEDDRVVAASLLLLSTSNGGIAGGDGGGDDQTNAAARFECSSCKKTFPSHQALGGHRASHKNVKGCFAITKSSGVDEQGGNSIVEGQSSNFPVRAEETGPNLGLILSMGHRCGICMKVFTSGQALGGHMRCHWEKNEDVPTSSFGPGPEPGPVSQPEEAQCVPDLNLPLQVPEDVGTSGGSPSNIQLDLRLGR